MGKKVIQEGVVSKVFQHQADAVLDQANPVSGTKYPVLATTRNCRLISISAVCTWTVQPTPLEIHVIIDGITRTFSVTDPVSTTEYTGEIWPPSAEVLTVAAFSISRAFLLEGRSISVTVEITGGTVSNLSARVKYAKIP